MHLLFIVSHSCNSWTVGCKGPLSMRFPRQEYWSGLHFLLQGIFLTHWSKLSLLHWQAVSLPLSHQGSPNVLKQTVLIEWSHGTTINYLTQYFIAKHTFSTFHVYLKVKIWVVFKRDIKWIKVMLMSNDFKNHLENGKIMGTFGFITYFHSTE